MTSTETHTPVFFIVAGETSGDLHGARLMRALRTIYPMARFDGIGGEQMEREGLRSIVPLSTINVVGFWEVAKRYGSFRALLHRCRAMLMDTAYSAFIPVDYPGFNMRLAATAKAQGIPVCWYIAPQLWAWGENRADRLRSLCDVLMVVFPFELEFFTQHRINTRFVGHPLLDDDAFSHDIVPIKERNNTIALLPGSRTQEIQRNLPIMLASAQILARTLKDYMFTIAQSPNVAPHEYHRIAERYTIQPNYTMDSRSLLRTARAGMIKTGTSTLEAGLLGLPFVMMYRTSWISYWLAKRVITLPSIALVNIILQAPIIPECIQQSATPELLAKEILAFVHDDQKSEILQTHLRTLRSVLGENTIGISSALRSAHVIAEYCR
jgi:lipid-A-disaccharide synthase